MKSALVVAGVLAASGPAFAQTPASLGPICTDRPTKANVPCTVPAGRLQLETDVVNWTRSATAGVRTDTVLWTNPTLKYGLTGRLDVEVNLAPYVTTRTTNASGVDTRVSGIGDLVTRVKWRLRDGSHGPELSAIPYLKFPTAKRGVGNGALEGGLILPLAIKLPNRFVLTLGPEFDAFADADGGGTHLNLASVLNLSRPVTDRLTLYGELWAGQNLDPAGQTDQYSADVAAAYLVTDTLQLDAGANFGLSAATPDVQIYIGVSRRF